MFEDVLGSAPEISGRGVELRSRGAISSQDSRAIRRRTWSREEVNLLNLKNLTACTLLVNIMIISVTGSSDLFCHLCSTRERCVYFLL